MMVRCLRVPHSALRDLWFDDNERMCRDQEGEEMDGRKESQEDLHVSRNV